MTGISRSSLFGRLNPTTLKSIESATSFCRMRGNPYVELVHWVQLLLQDPRNDMAAIRTHYGLDEARLAQDVVSALDTLPRGASAISDFAPQIEEAIERAWLLASLGFGQRQIRSGHLIVAMLTTPTLRNAFYAISATFRQIPADRLNADFAAIVAGSAEDVGASTGDAEPADAAPQGAGQSSEALARFSTDLTEKARRGEIDAVIGRDAEIRQMIDILLRRRQNNPILTGEAGVGKTAVVEGLARRIADGDVPPSLRNVRLAMLDIGLLQAGASVKGEFEKRLRHVIDAVEAAATPIILFIDEAHSLIGAGGAAGTGDAANLLKPALARGRLRTIAATTWSEYRQYFEKDPALTRRFQPVHIGEPDTVNAIAMLGSICGVMEAHHGVPILREAVEAAVTLSQRYIPARHLPDKAVSLLDTAAARVAISQHATPAVVEDCRRRIALLDIELAAVRREAAGRYTDGGSIEALEEELAAARIELSEVEARWQREKALLAAVRAARDAKQGDDTAALDKALEELRVIQGDDPLMFGEVDAGAVAAVVQDWTGIPVGRMVKDEIGATLTLAERLRERVIGQDGALDMIARRVQTSRARLDDPNKPVGVFMLCGPSGVGKTETAHALAELVHSGDDSLIVINMSEYQEAHTVSTLKGAPAGYIGFGQGGVLTEAVRRRPYSVVLLDEVEKAHPDVHEMFFQVFDKGYMEDSEGRYIDFRNTLILLTSNVGTDSICALTGDGEIERDDAQLVGALRPELLKTFPPALLGRLIVLPYRPLSRPMLERIVALKLRQVQRRIDDNHGITVDYDDAVADHIVSRCTEPASGGRMIDAILTNHMLPDIARLLLERQAVGDQVSALRIAVGEDCFTYRLGRATAQVMEAAE
ncbi:MULTISPECIES: type VI secretion system ATPase TssH [unclassified Sphingobium]|uniref:type VI secretion system ATPase TssH n=1 Tax=unclassified Sphingobium TaxID=2611147 RepID=UPI0035A58EE8